jgi:hypothetical protein
MDTVPLGDCPANPTDAPRVPAGPNSLAATATRRGLLGAIAAVPMLGVAMPALAADSGPDPEWSALVADFHAKHAIWLETLPESDNCLDAFQAACESLPPKPEKPDSDLPGNMLNMTLAEIKAISATPEHKAAWAAYETDLAAWTAQEDALRETIYGPSKARYDTSYAAYADALNALCQHRVAGLRELGEKIEIVVADYEDDVIPSSYFDDILADVRHLAGRA